MAVVEPPHLVSTWLPHFGSYSEYLHLKTFKIASLFMHRAVAGFLQQRTTGCDVNISMHSRYLNVTLTWGCRDCRHRHFPVFLDADQWLWGWILILLGRECLPPCLMLSSEQFYSRQRIITRILIWSLICAASSFPARGGLTLRNLRGLCSVHAFFHFWGSEPFEN